MHRRIVLTCYFWSTFWAASLKSLVNPQSSVYRYADLIEADERVAKYEFDQSISTKRLFGDIFQAHLKTDPESIYAMKLVLLLDSIMMIGSNPCWHYQNQIRLSQTNEHILKLIEAIPIIDTKTNVSICVVISPMAIEVFKNALFSIEPHNEGNKQTPLTSEEFYNYKAANTESIVLFLEQIIAGVFQMHEDKFTHNDLKPSNILLVLDDQEMPHAVINDFDVASDLKIYINAQKYQSVLSKLRGDHIKLKLCITQIIQLNSVDIFAEGLEEHFHSLIDQGYTALYKQYDKPDQNPRSSLLLKFMKDKPFESENKFLI